MSSNDPSTDDHTAQITPPSSKFSNEDIRNELNALEEKETSIQKTLLSLATTILLFFALGLLRNPWRDILIIILVISVHELGHLTAMKLFGYKDLKMFFIPMFGAAASGKSFETSGSRKAIISLAGPVPGLLIGMLLGAVFITTNMELIRQLALYFIFINALNLLPFYPFDGGRFMHDILFCRNRYLDTIVKIATSAVFMVLAWLDNSFFWGFIGFIVLVTIPINLKLGRLAHELKDKFDSNLAIPLNQAPAQIADAIFQKIKSAFPAAKKVNVIANYSNQLWERIHTQAPKGFITLLFLGGYSLALVISIFTYFGIYQYDNDISDTTATIEMDPSDPAAYYERGNRFLETGQYDEAIADFNKVLEIEPKHSDAYVSRGLAYTDTGRYDQALADYNKALEMNTTNPKAYYGRGYAFAAKGHLDQAIADYNKVLEADPEFSFVYVERGRAYHQQGRFDLAMADFNKALEIDPDEIFAYYGRGNTWAAKQNFDNAIADYDQFIEMVPVFAEVYVKRGLAYEKTGQYDRAIDDFSKALNFNPSDASCYYHMGNARVASSDTARAIEDYTRALRIDPTYAKAFYKRGRAWAEYGDWKKAIADYDQALKIDPSEAEPYVDRGNAWAQSGDVDRAIADYTKAIELKPDDPRGYYFRGQIYTMKSQPEKACSDLKRACELGYCDGLDKLKSKLDCS
jgi:tetratricopeptide (TPR) repeat protein